MSDDEFAVKYEFGRKLFSQRFEHLGEIPIQRLLIATLDEELLAVPKDKNAEAVPLGLVNPLASGGDHSDPLGSIGRNRRTDDEVHG